ncbi:hypothetical protein PTI98_001336 [Pleurotus ostreatus]|nr:hypothetical protein PTI98_001336 [Pleurotus ostreatus]
MMAPAPFEAHDLALVLSSLHSYSGALPPDFFSLPLRKRHHFLAIDPSDHHEFLSWPSPDSAGAVDRLLEYAGLNSLPNFSVAYTADAESTFAHCHLRLIHDPASSPDLRLVFHWDDPTRQWKFHNTALMPFPPGAEPSLSQSTTMAPFLHDDFLHEPEAIRVDHDHDNDDAYWDAYGDDDEDAAPRRIAADLKADHQNASEDAYWAQYAVVQGSADSTQPSPLPTKRNKSNHLPNDPSHPHLQPHSRNEPIVFSRSLFNPLSKLNQDFPSPNTLTERLNAISARPTASPLDDPESVQSSDFTTATDPITMSDSDSTSPSPPPGLVKLGVKSAGSPERRLPVDLSVDTASPPFQNLGSSPGPASKEKQFPLAGQAMGSCGDEGAEAVKESIRGIYRLWKAGKLQAPPNGIATSSEQDVFINLVRQAVQEP